LTIILIMRQIRFQKTKTGGQLNGLMVMVIAVGAVFALVLGLIISNGISKPITKVVAAAGKLAEGDMDITFDINSKDKQENLWMLSEIWSKVRKSRHL